MIRHLVCVLTTAFAGAALAQGPAPVNQHIDVNVYPALTGQSGLYDLNVSPTQKGPPGTIAVTYAAPPPAYSFQQVLANTHGYVSTGVSTGGGYGVDGGVSIPIVPGRAELNLQAGTGQLPTYKINGFKSPAVTYDTYGASLSLHPSDNLTAVIGVQGLRLHANGLGQNAFATSAPANAFGPP